MSRWEQERRIGTAVNPESLELMLCASDVVAWLRDRDLHVTADDLVSGWLNLSSDLIDGSGS